VQAASEAAAASATITGHRDGNRYDIVEQQASSPGPFYASYHITVPRSVLLDLHDNAGNVSVDDAHTDIAVSSDAGNVRVDLASDWLGSSVRASSNAGNVELDTPPGLKAVLDAYSLAGKVWNDARLPASGSGPVLHVHSNAGNVTVK
jgi:hypothetical protein